jgi:hypothetical protein
MDIHSMPLNVMTYETSRRKLRMRATKGSKKSSERLKKFHFCINIDLSYFMCHIDVHTYLMSTPLTYSSHMRYTPGPHQLFLDTNSNLVLLIFEDSPQSIRLRRLWFCYIPTTIILLNAVVNALQKKTKYEHDVIIEAQK